MAGEVEEKREFGEALSITRVRDLRLSIFWLGMRTAEYASESRSDSERMVGNQEVEGQQLLQADRISIPSPSDLANGQAIVASFEPTCIDFNIQHNDAFLHDSHAFCCCDLFLAP